MTAQRVWLTAGLIGLAGLAAGCDRIGNPLTAIGGRVPPPDEFAVMERRPLIMPPALGLPEPRPGAPSPLDPNPERDAAMALLGTAEPRPVSREVTSGEAALLTSADAAAASNDIRVQLTLDERTRDEPYEPPSVFELLGLAGGPGIDDAERLEPVAESQRLQREGVAAPNDPLAEPPPPEAAAGPEPEAGFEPYVAPRQTPRPLRP